MYVDKMLRGSRAVQTLGRLARITHASGRDRDTDGPQSRDDGAAVTAGMKKPMVVDFVNLAGAIQESFEEFAGVTEFRTGEKSRRQQIERVMDHCVSRILHSLVPLLDSCCGGLQNATPTQVGALQSSLLSFFLLFRGDQPLPLLAAEAERGRSVVRRWLMQSRLCRLRFARG